MLEIFKKFKTEFRNGTFSPHIQEEYLVKGSFDIPYLSFKYKTPCSRQVGNDMINSLFGTIKFPVTKNKNEVSREEFEEYYKFGVYPNIRGWIGYLYAHTGKVLTREKLFEYVMG